ncbi:tyrosinase [Fictibacillus macauensis ZFHKF-1]|uniref:Tyrosinase n=1 Tax=Fictibacillus macauensis ZFHKF-1 TaxID=1196324 RepID=I8UCZ7_9BACL|nr:tyrosinase family protein [Fictibacillus macauensis]EIT84795.1 tyrosinase [Fictibacillus macauensis ZFHKF-1]
MNERVRKSVNSLTASEKNDFVNAVLTLKAEGKYNKYIAWHASAGGFQTPQGADRTAAHMCPAFLPWHREFLLRFERDLQSVNPSIMLPYWDWARDAMLRDPSQAPIWQPDFMGGNGNPRNDNLVEDGPFIGNRWITIDEEGRPAGGLRRDFGQDGLRLPTETQVRNALTIPVYDRPPYNMDSRNSFRNTLEGFPDGPQLHNLVHLWVGGQMGFVPIAPNDPVFFLHHANVDRIWAMWQDLYPTSPYLPQENGPYGQNYHDPMYPWNAQTPSDVNNYRALGYVYEASSISNSPKKTSSLSR